MNDLPPAAPPSNQAKTPANSDCLKPAVGMQFMQYVFDMTANSRDTDTQQRGDLAGRVPIAQVLQNLSFPGRKHSMAVATTGFTRLRKSL